MKDGLIKKGLHSLRNTRVVNSSLRFLEWMKHGERRLFDYEYGNRVIREALQGGRPQAIGKLGHGELNACRKYLACKNRSDVEARTTKQRQIMYFNAGLFPPDYTTFVRYARLLLEEVLPEITIICPWYNFGEARIIKRYCPHAIRINDLSLQASYRSPEPWTSMLEGKKVLVALPFERTVRLQYTRRELLWPANPSILPEFHLDTLKVPLHAHLVEPVHRDWFEALEAMKLEMARRDFDVALIGAGAYSLPLAVHARRLGRQGVHLGGATQVLFGIKGRRWESTADARCFNEHWIRPLQEETPAGVEKVEGGCYW